MCRACHDSERNAPARIGTSLWGIVNQRKENVRRILWSIHRLNKSRFGSFERTFRDSLERLGWTRQHTSIPLRIRSDRFGYLRCDSKGSHD